MKKAKKLFIKTYGCQMNEYDSQRIRDLLHKKFNTSITDSPEKADIIILNTCSVREKAQEKVFSDLGRYKKIKQKNPYLIIGVGGCVASQEGKMIFRRAPYVDIVFGPQTLHRLPQMIESSQRAIDISFPTMEKFDELPEPKIDGPTAYISIMEGCNNFCTYCIVPYTRGREFSRPVKDILLETEQLCSQSVREIILLGQNVNNYFDSKANIRLPKLIHEIAKFDKIGRIRFITSHPKSFTDDMVQMFADVPKLANHIHLPIQHGSNKILKLMHRGYTAEQYLEIVQKLRAVNSQISISSDFIVGFPGETETDFTALMDVVNQVQFDHSFSFIYSKRPGTPAAKMADDVDLKIKKHRLTILQTALKQSEQTISKNMLGTRQKILVTGTAKKDPNILSGKTENNRTVNFKADKKLIGNFANVEITKTNANSLLGITIQ